MDPSLFASIHTNDLISTRLWSLIGNYDGKRKYPTTGSFIIKLSQTRVLLAVSLYKKKKKKKFNVKKKKKKDFL